MAKRIYSNYTDEEMAEVAKYARGLGFSPSAFQRYCVMLSVPRLAPVDGGMKLEALIGKMDLALNSMDDGETFIVSALTPEEWPSLTRSEKMTLSKHLKRYVESHPDSFRVHESVSGRPNVYIKGPSGKALEPPAGE